MGYKPKTVRGVYCVFHLMEMGFYCTNPKLDKTLTQTKLRLSLPSSSGIPRPLWRGGCQFILIIRNIIDEITLLYGVGFFQGILNQGYIT